MGLAGKELKFHWKKYLLVELIVILMMFMVIFLSGLVNGLGRAVSSSVEQINADQFILSEDAEKLLTVSSISTEDSQQLLTEYGARAAGVDVQRMYLKKADSDEKMDVIYFAINPQSYLNPAVYQGESLAGENEIVLDDDFASKGIQVGDTVEDAASGIQLKVVGFTKDAMYGHVSVGYITTDTYRNMMKQVNPMYQESVHAIALQGSITAELPEGLQQYSKATIIDSLPGYKAEQMTITMVEWLLVIITAIIIAIFFFVINLQKEKEFGVMKALGISMGRIVGMMLTQVLIIAVSGAVLAALMVWAMSQGLPATMPFYLENQAVAVVLGAFIVFSLVGSLTSVINVSRIDPAKIIGGDLS